MSTRLFAVLFVALFVVGVFPVLFLQQFGTASAGVTEGFMLAAQDVYHALGCLAIGVFAAWAAGEAILLLPLCMLLMLTIGSLTEVSVHTYPAMHYFLAGAIILFAMCVGLFRQRRLLLAVPPVSILAYCSGSALMENIPSITTPLFFMMGTTIATVFMLAIGLALGLTLLERIHDTVKRFKSSVAFASFLSLF